MREKRKALMPPPPKDNIDVGHLFLTPKWNKNQGNTNELNFSSPLNQLSVRGVKWVEKVQDK